MREIKFRGKKVTGEWVYGSYQADVMNLNKHTIIYSDNEGFYCEDEVIPETVGQYIGMKDRKGKEIYEGDIDGSDSEERMYVVFEDGCFGLKFMNESSYFDWCINWDQTEIMGNIHDN